MSNPTTFSTTFFFFFDYPENSKPSTPALRPIHPPNQLAPAQKGRGRDVDQSPPSTA